MDEEFYDVESDERQEMERLEAMLVAAASKPKPKPEPKPELSDEAKGNLRWLQTTFNSKFTPPITMKDMFYLIGTRSYDTEDLTLLREDQRIIDEDIANIGEASEEERIIIDESKEHLEGELNDIQTLIKTGRNRKGGNQSKRKTRKRKVSKRKASKRKASKRKTHKRRKASKRKVSKRKVSKRK